MLRNWMISMLTLHMMAHSFALFAAEENMFGRQTQNEGFFAVPAPAAVVIDGDLGEWDLSGQIWSYADTSVRNRYSVKTAAMWDKDHLYLSFVWRDPMPLNNTIHPQSSPKYLQYGSLGDAVHLRVLAGKQPSWFTLWGFDKGTQPVVSAYYWAEEDKHAGGTEVMRYAGKDGRRELGDGVESAYALAADGNGFTHELKLTWKVIYKQDWIGEANQTLRMGMEFHWGGSTGRDWPMHWYADNMQSGVTSRQAFRMAKNSWGDLTTVAESVKEPRRYVEESLKPSACISRVFPANPPNDGILFVDHSKNKRSGHLGHALVQYAPGKILAFYPNCSSDNAGHSAVGWMEFKRSEDGGKTWGPPQELTFTKDLFNKQSGRTAFAEKAVVTDKGEIVLFYLVSGLGRNYWEPYWEPLVSKSIDAGKTWSEPKPVCSSRGRIYDAEYHNGEILVLHFANDAEKNWTGNAKEHVYELHVSTDGGETFTKRSELPFNTKGRGYGALGRLNDGSLIAYIYNEANESMLDYAISTDGGTTWPKVGTSTVSRKIRNPQFTAFGGKYYLHGRSGQHGAGRGHLVLYMSEDGVTWDDGVYLNMCTSTGSGAYSNSIVVDSPDGNGRQRLLIQSSITYSNTQEHRTNIHHWWLE